MTFPIIQHIDDVLWSIKDRTDFIVVDKGDYKVIDYVYTLTDSFDEPIRKELRGLKFLANGDILARPLHKFGNLGEFGFTQENVDWAESHTIHTKFDGSMVHTAILNGEVRLMTRMGLTDVALQAEKYLTRGVTDFVLKHPLHTFIFEYVGPENRIVLSYDKPELILLAIRNIHTGNYMNLSEFLVGGMDLGELFSAKTGLRYAEALDISGHTDIKEFAEYAKNLTGVEGFVVKFGNDWFKIKSEEYVLKHHMKDSVTKESNVLELILRDQLDDVLAFLDEADRARLEEYQQGVRLNMLGASSMVQSIVDEAKDVDQKTFATVVLKDLPHVIRTVAFTTRKLGGGPQMAYSVIKEYLLANCQHRDMDDFRPLIGVSL